MSMTVIIIEKSFDNVWMSRTSAHTHAEAIRAAVWEHFGSRAEFVVEHGLVADDKIWKYEVRGHIFIPSVDGGSQTESVLVSIMSVQADRRVIRGRFGSPTEEDEKNSPFPLSSVTKGAAHNIW